MTTILYILMGFVSGTAFGGWAALSIHKARFGKKSLPEKGHDATPAQIAGMPWKKRAKEYDLPFKNSCGKGSASALSKSKARCTSGTSCVSGAVPRRNMWVPVGNSCRTGLSIRW